MAIRSIIIVNHQGKVRLAKFYEPVSHAQERQIVRDCYNLVSKRGDTLCNFLEGGSIWGSDTKIIYRHYATLYFIFCCLPSESELGVLDVMHLFVETLDKCFEKACELDLVFHCDKIHYVLDEIICGGLIFETNGDEIMSHLTAMQKLEARP
eukprot:TRINITY_DN15524_c0_g1::TRINITY_DN15524_c0_g1_i1::g.30553::m.30553 TRINITY_DN15524_c0_g1::TRINITY_DN15524_c0_g1_i1::g.30553  ORF type:complete len:169 (-),score=24.09,sp/Q9DCR2/AP3S1_MOUSE/58.50/3e-60,Clat_adaptor_s/PF01217.15/2.6e-45 TRINITY_DN15524_c0_g1_i1:631-1086(-)